MKDGTLLRAPDPAVPLPEPIETIGAAAAMALVLLFAALELAVAARSGLTGDEAYYWQWSRHLAVSYYDHPPMLAWWIRLGTDLFGATPLGIRFLSVLSVPAISAVVYATGRILFDRAIAIRAALWFNAILLVGTTGYMSTPDAPSTLFWALTVLFFVLVTKSGRGAWWLAVGVSAGLGTIAKYTDLFLGLGLLLAILTDPASRKWLASPWLWGGGLIAAAIFAPVLIWNHEHGWSSFAFQFGRIVPRDLEPWHLGEFLVVQATLLNGFIAAFALLAFYLWIRGRPCPWRREIGLLAATVAPLLAFMAVHAVHDRVLENWLWPAYPGLALAAAAAAQSYAGTGRLGRALGFMRRFAAPLGIGAAAAALCAIFVLQDPPNGAALPIDPLRYLRGWPELARDIENLRRQAGASWIATSNFVVTAQLAYEMRSDDVPIEQVTERIRYAFAPPPNDALLGEPALLLVREYWPDSTDYRRCFGAIMKVGTLLRRGLAGQRLMVLTAYRVEKPIAGLFQTGCEAAH
jgi:4-amino-4-deoxy-L-arabinose transferase-like glycosyltransferase